MLICNSCKVNRLLPVATQKGESPLTFRRGLNIRAALKIATSGMSSKPGVFPDEPANLFKIIERAIIRDTVSWRSYCKSSPVHRQEDKPRKPSTRLDSGGL